MAELGVGVVIPEVRIAAAQAVWPRAFAVVIATQTEQQKRLRVPFRVAAFRHSLADSSRSTSF